MLKNMKSVLFIAVMMCFLVPARGKCAGTEDEIFNIDFIAAGAASWMSVKLDEPLKEQLRLAAMSQHCDLVNESGQPFPVNERLVNATVEHYLNYMESLTGVPEDVTAKEYPYLRSAVLLMLYSYVEGIEDELSRHLQKDEIAEEIFCNDFRQFSQASHREVTALVSNGE